MGEENGRKSPPLLSKGYYNLDFDALDDNTNPIQIKKEIPSSPPLIKKKISCNSETGQDNPPVIDEKVQDDNKLLKEPKETPKRKKSKSSKHSSAVPKSDGSQETDALTVSQTSEGGLDDGVPSVADKPVKAKKVVKKHKTRPVSKSYEEQDTQDKPQQLDEPMNAKNTTPAPVPATGSVNETESSPAISNTASNTGTPQHSVVEKKSSQPGKATPLPENPTAHPQKTSPEADQVSKPSEAVPCPSKNHQDPEKPSSLPEKLSSSPTEGHLLVLSSEKRRSRSRSASVASEDGKEILHKKDRSGGKTRKSKSKGKKHVALEAGLEGVDGPVRKSGRTHSSSDKERTRRSSSRVSSKGDAVEAEDSAVDPDVTKVRQPTPVVEQKPLDLHPQSSAKGDSDMTSSHSKESVVRLVQVLKYSQSDWNKLRQELELNFQTELTAKEKEWSSKIADRDARLATLEDMNKKLRQTNEDMRTVMGEFEKTIGQLQSEKEKSNNASQQSLQDVLKEKDQALEDLRSVETAFSDLHRRYEKTKAVLEGFKQNEDTLKKCVQDQQNKLKKAEQKVQVLKLQAEEKLEKATEDIEKVQKASASEIAKLEAALRKAHVRVESLEMSLEQKVKENKELTAICDELIAKVQ